MSELEQPTTSDPKEMDSATRRAFMKMAGVGALGLAYAHPVVESVHHWTDRDNQGSPVGGGGGHESSSESDSDSGSKS